MKFYAGLDVGGTSGRVKFSGEDRTPIGEYLGEGCAYNTEGYERGREKYRRLMEEALSKYGLKSSNCLGICIAASGIDSKEQERQVRIIFEEMGFAKERILAVNDCELFLYLSKGPVLVTISGTGAICCGRNEAGEVYRTGGWNHVLSDEGSAYDIGLQTVKAYADHLDGRISCPVLARKVQKATNITTLEQADVYVNDHLLDKSPVGKLAVLCAQAAEEGDPVAEDILKQCAAKVFALVWDTCCKMEGSPDTRIRRELDASFFEGPSSKALQADLWLWGSVNVKNEFFRAQITEMAAKKLPRVTVRIPQKTALDIALGVAEETFA